MAFCNLLSVAISIELKWQNYLLCNCISVWIGQKSTGLVISERQFYAKAGWSGWLAWLHHSFCVEVPLMLKASLVINTSLCSETRARDYNQWEIPQESFGRVLTALTSEMGEDRVCPPGHPISLILLFFLSACNVKYNLKRPAAEHDRVWIMLKELLGV